MEYLIWVVLALAIGGVIYWKKKEGNLTKEEQEVEDEILGARSSSFLSRTSDKEDTQYNGVPNPSPTKRPAPPSPPAMRSLGGRSSTSRQSYVAESAPVQHRDSSLDMLSTVVVMDALGVFDSKEEDKPSRELPTVPADPIPEPAYEPRATTQTDFSSTTDYSEPSRTNTDSGWSSNDRSDSGWSSSSSDSSSYDSGSSSSSSDSSSW